MPTTSLDNIHSDVIQTQIFPRLDARSLSTVATISSYLHTLTSDQNLWSHICNYTWPSITDPRVHAIISTFPDGHRSFFNDSFPSLITQVNHHNSSCCNLDKAIDHPCPSQLISAVDIRYQSNNVYSTVEFTDITTDHFLSSNLLIKLNQDVDAISTPIELEVDEFGVNEATLAHLKHSLTLSWIMIDPSLKRACNLSSVKPFSVKKDWMSNDTHIRYDIVLPGCGRHEVVQCRIQVVLGVGGKGLYVREVMMKVMDLDCGGVKGGEFLMILQRAIMGEDDNVRRKVVDDDGERWRSMLEFKEMKRQRREMTKKEQDKWDIDIIMNYIGILVSFCFTIYFLQC
ncbi:hypothetical protein QVD17_09050 [Tagetes erecta]|uniref:F-box domain-containing protein n=1 Tax=Tagetes erecta TaxID=13708 RepID=A0AAD8L347_TARER|nr:hypothetical protein QVD17_09050 [Tagetes erecta]